jgi:hypothetical protein
MLAHITAESARDIYARSERTGMESESGGDGAVGGELGQVIDG